MEDPYLLLSNEDFPLLLEGKFSFALSSYLVPLEAPPAAAAAAAAACADPCPLHKTRNMRALAVDRVISWPRAPPSPESQLSA